MAEDTTPSGRELEILKVLWELGPASVREVHARMCPGGELAFNTVQTLLRIMEDKGLIRHRAKGRTFIYEPIYNRDRVTARILHRVFDGALEEEIAIAAAESGDARALARDGLVNLGYAPLEAEQLLDGIDGEDPQELLAVALRKAGTSKAA